MNKNLSPSQPRIIPYVRIVQLPFSWKTYHIYIDVIAIVNYPCYYCNGFQAFCQGGAPAASEEQKKLFVIRINLMLCRVESYSGFRLHERPKRFTWKETWLEIDQIMEQWATPELFCFKVRVDDRIYRLEYHAVKDIWDVELTRSAGGFG